MTMKLYRNIKRKIVHFQLEIEIAGLFLALIGLGLAVLSIQQANQDSLERYKQLEPAVLNVTHWANISDPQDKFLFINIKNMAKFKPTGNISIYKIEVNPHKPAFILSSLEPGENRTISLGINYTEIPFSVKADYGWFIKDDRVIESWTKITFPCYKTFYIYEHDSISYRLACDNCNSEGVVGRVPGFEECGGLLEFDPKKIYENKTMTVKLPVYSWIQFTLDDLKEK